MLIVSDPVLDSAVLSAVDLRRHAFKHMHSLVERHGLQSLRTFYNVLPG